DLTIHRNCSGFLCIPVLQGYSIFVNEQYVSTFISKNLPNYSIVILVSVEKLTETMITVIKDRLQRFEYRRTYHCNRCSKSLESVFKDVKFFTGLIVVLFIVLLVKPLLVFFTYIIPGFAFFRFPQRLSIITVFCFAILTGYGLDFLRRFQWYRQNSYIAIIILSVVIFDLFRYGWTQHSTVDYEKWNTQPKTVNFLKSKQTALDDYRIWSFRTDYTWAVTNILSKGTKGDTNLFLTHREILQPNTNLCWKIPSANLYGGFGLKRYNQLVKLINRKCSLTPQFPGSEVIIPEEVIKILGLLNVKHILALWNLKSNFLSAELELPFIKNFDKIEVYRNPLFLPRAFIVSKARVLSDENSILSAMFEKQFNPQQEIILEKRITHGSERTDSSTAKVLKYSDREIIIDANLTDNGFLVLTDTYYPGWKAFVDGIKTEILCANYIMRAVAIGKGNHRIKFYYSPVLFKIGFILSIFTGLIIVFCFLIYRKV
ncbi:MAG: YfhO family protein, partial [Elusimicrobiota bacterium]